MIAAVLSGVLHPSGTITVRNRSREQEEHKYLAARRRVLALGISVDIASSLMEWRREEEFGWFVGSDGSSGSFSSSLNSCSSAS